MFNWDDVRFFLAVKREGNLARASAALRMDATTVGRRLGQLEEELGARLFDRTSGGFVLTAAGRRLLPRAERIECEAISLARDLSGEDSKLEGTVRLSATEMLTTRFIAPHLGKFRTRYPGITLDLICTNREVDLARGEADIALRLARPRQEHLVVRKLLSIELGLYASLDYVDKFGMPSPSDLANHRFILFSDTANFRRENAWVTQHLGQGEVAMRSDSVSSVVSAAAGGLGIAMLPVLVAEQDGRLVRTPLSGSPEPRVVWQAVHRDLVNTARIRAVLDFLGRVLIVRPTPRPVTQLRPAG
ncbi:MAG: LysR family transcriptional regulator [Nannocystaceae bacterium]|nr:LysR family transcriptional regulator [Nannocystaceae bacterium]